MTSAIPVRSMALATVALSNLRNASISLALDAKALHLSCMSTTLKLSLKTLFE